MRIGVVTFPGSNGDMDCIHTLEQMSGVEPRLLWHKNTNLDGANALILPGGFAHGDYLRAGAIARFSPIMRAVEDFAQSGGPVLGICNGFQVLTEAELLPGALIRNQHILFRCTWVHVKVVSNRSPWLSAVEPGTVLRIAVAHGEGNYFASEDDAQYLQSNDQVALQYCEPDGRITPDANHNGSIRNIAAVSNRAGNVLGMMPHPERSADRLLGSEDGRSVFRSIVQSLTAGRVGV